MNEKLEKLNQEIEKTEARLRRAQHKEKMLEHQIKTLNRKEWTHRLCTRGAMPESHLSKSEPDIIYQYAAPTKVETLAGMKEIVPVIKDILTKAIVENAIRKLEKIPEPEYSQFVAATKARFLAERDNTIRQRLAAAKAQESILQGHDLSGIERFRFFLSDEGYRNAKRSEQEGEIKIKSHAAVIAGKHHRGKGQLRCPAPFPCAGSASYPFVDLPYRIFLRSQLF